MRKARWIMAALIAGALLAAISCATRRGGETTDLPATQPLRDGTFEGESFKFPGAFRAEVTVESGRIAAIRVTKQAALKKYTDMLDPMIARMIEAQNARVDAVTGATISSEALRKAVRDALRQAAARAEPSETETDPSPETL